MAAKHLDDADDAERRARMQHPGARSIEPPLRKNRWVQKLSRHDEALPQAVGVIVVSALLSSGVAASCSAAERFIVGDSRIVSEDLPFSDGLPMPRAIFGNNRD